MQALQAAAPSRLCIEHRSATMPDEIEAVADAIDEIADAIEDADDSDKKDISWKETLELAKVEYMDLLGVSPSFAELMDVLHAAARTLHLHP